MTAVRQSQEVLELLTSGSPQVQTSQQALEVLASGSPQVQTSQHVLELLVDSASFQPSQLVWMDGFDHYSSGQFSRVYHWATGSLTTGRVGSGQAGSFTSAVQGFTKVIPTAAQAWRVSCAFQITSFNAEPTWSLYSGNSQQCEVRCLTAGTRQMRISRNNNTLGTSATAQVIKANYWYHMEWYCNISDTGNSILRIDGEEWVNVSNADTNNGGNGADRFAFLANASTTVLIDDLAIWQEWPTTTPSFFGDLRVHTLYPDNNGNYSQFTGSDGNSTNNYQLVDEAQCNDADYVQSSTASQKDSYSVENPTRTPVTIKGVQVNSMARKDDAGERSQRLFVRIGSTDYESDTIGLSASFVNNTHLMPLDPSTAAAWTASSLNAMEIGTKVQT